MGEIFFCDLMDGSRKCLLNVEEPEIYRNKTRILIFFYNFTQFLK